MITAFISIIALVLINGFFAGSEAAIVAANEYKLQNDLDNGNKRAELALDMFYYHCKKHIGAYSAALGGLDAIVFTAGIGENDHNIRANICKDLEFLGVKIDSGLNSNNDNGNKVISASDSKVKVFVINTNEELRIAQDTERLSRRLDSLKQSKRI